MSHTHEPAGHHGMLLLGTNKLYACHLPMFAMPEHRYQAILEIELKNNDMQTFLNTRNENPGRPLIVMNQEEILLKDIVNSTAPLEAFVSFANDNGDPMIPHVIDPTTVTVKKTLLFKQLNLSEDYPENLSYYLYGTDSEFHLSHVLTKAPNFQQELDISLHDVTPVVDRTIQDLMNRFSPEPTIISIPELEEKNKQPIMNDPLDKSEYTVRIPIHHTSAAMTGKFSILNKFWINNGPLNQGLTDHVHMDHANVHHTHTKPSDAM